MGRARPWQARGRGAPVTSVAVTDVDAVVVGAGVVGLTTAISLAEAGLSTRIVSATPPPAATSIAAGAIWGPVRCGPPQRCLAWSRTALDVLSGLAADPDSGVHFVSGREVAAHHATPPDWLMLLPESRLLGPGDLPPGFVSGWAYTALAMNMPVYLDYLLARYAALGGSVAVETVASLADVAAPVVVNCTGIGAATWCPTNRSCRCAGRSSSWRIPASASSTSTTATTARTTCTRSRTPTSRCSAAPPTRGHRTWRRGRRCPPASCGTSRPSSRRYGMPGLSRNGLGCARSARRVRLEAEPLSGGPLLWHNYGHGGAGVTLSWGCAAELTAAVLAVTGNGRIARRQVLLSKSHSRQ